MTSTVLFLLASGFAVLAYAVYARWVEHAEWDSFDASDSVALDFTSYQMPPLKERTSTRMVMGLKRLDESNWLTIDSHYRYEHDIRLRLVATARKDVIECLPPSRAACYEVLDLVVAFLTSRFPEQFSKSRTLSGQIIRNHMTGETFPIGYNCCNPLETAALLAMEDFNILTKDPASGDYLLQASATLFPAGWKLQERIGTSLARLHAPVPGWHENLAAHVNRYFDHLSPKTAMERTSFFIQATKELFQVASIDTPVDAASEIKLEDVTMRRERQTFTRLPKSNAVLFTVRTYMVPLVDLTHDELRVLRNQIRGWTEDVRAYKGYNVWGQMAEKWFEEQLGPQVHEDMKASSVQCHT